MTDPCSHGLPLDVRCDACLAEGLEVVELHAATHAPCAHCSDLAQENARLRYHLTELAKVADQAALVLATLEGENSDEDEQVERIIEGIMTWGPPAILGRPQGAS